MEGGGCELCCAVMQGVDMHTPPSFTDALARRLQGMQFSVVVTEGRPDETGLAMARALDELGVPVQAILDSAVAFALEVLRCARRARQPAPGMQSVGRGHRAAGHPGLAEPRAALKLRLGGPLQCVQSSGQRCVRSTGKARVRKVAYRHRRKRWHAGTGACRPMWHALPWRQAARMPDVRLN
jgi:hypothetical protein